MHADVLGLMSQPRLAPALAAPLALLTSLRMELASRLPALGAEDTATIREAVDYRSEAAFDRAFARHAGIPPGRFRRREALAGSAAG